MLLHVQDYEHLISKQKQLTMKYLIDKEKLEEKIAELESWKYSNESPSNLQRKLNTKLSIMFLSSILDTLVPYEEKKEEQWKMEGVIGCHHDAMGNCNTHGDDVKCDCSCHKQDDRCTKCNGEGKLMNQWDKATCVYCNGTGKEPRKEQDTRTHAWETKTYTQDEVRKMLEDLKMRDNLAGNSKEVQEDRKHMNAKIDKKIAEL